MTDRHPNVTELEHESNRESIIAAPVNFDEEVNPRCALSNGRLLA